MAKHDGEKLVGAWLSPPVASAIEKAAAAHGISKSQLIRRSLRSTLTGAKK